MARTSLEGAGAKTSPKTASAGKGGKGGQLERAQIIKLSVSVGVIVLVIVWLLYSMEIISFGGSNHPPEVSAEEQRALDEQIARDAEMRQRAEREPTAPRPPPVGSQ